MISFFFFFLAIGDEILQGLRITALEAGVIALVVVMDAIAIGDFKHPRGIIEIKVAASGLVHLQPLDIKEYP